nr:hypothetical protein [Arthrospira sp. SH-MAG29]
MILMPPKSYGGKLPPLTRHQEEVSDRLRGSNTRRRSDRRSGRT